MNNPSDIVILYNKAGSVMNTTYREFLSNSKYITPKLIDNSAINLYQNRKQVEEAKTTNLALKPAKIVVAYDLLGNVINPGIELTKEEQLQTTSDAIFDSEQIIIDNLLRTKVVPQDTSKVYYQDSNDVYHLADYKVHQIYCLNLDQDRYYYRSHEDLMRAFLKYLSINSQRVG